MIRLVTIVGATGAQSRAGRAFGLPLGPGQPRARRDAGPLERRSLGPSLRAAQRSSKPTWTQYRSSRPPSPGHTSSLRPTLWGSLPHSVTTMPPPKPRCAPASNSPALPPPPSTVSSIRCAAPCSARAAISAGRFAVPHYEGKAGADVPRPGVTSEALMASLLKLDKSDSPGLPQHANNLGHLYPRPEITNSPVTVCCLICLHVARSV